MKITAGDKMKILECIFFFIKPVPEEDIFTERQIDVYIWKSILQMCVGARSEEEALDDESLWLVFIYYIFEVTEKDTSSPWILSICQENVTNVHRHQWKQKG